MSDPAAGEWILIICSHRTEMTELICPSNTSLYISLCIKLVGMWSIESSSSIK